MPVSKSLRPFALRYEKVSILGRHKPGTADLPHI